MTIKTIKIGRKIHQIRMRECVPSRCWQCGAVGRCSHMGHGGKKDAIEHAEYMDIIETEKRRLAWLEEAARLEAAGVKRSKKRQG